jgi:dihydrofolate synthase/folylpolyglutamate synthase
MVDFAERIRLNGVPIAHEDVVTLVSEIKPHVAVIPRLTTFELTTALAFLHFAKQGVQVAVIEVGLGGRLDATNVITPRVSVITSLSYDHTQILGETLAQIAQEKAGIIKTGIPVVLAPQKEEARQVVTRIAEERLSPLILVGQDYLYAPLSHDLDRQVFLIWSHNDQALADRYIESGKANGWKPVHLTIPLLGSHQVENAANAYTALMVAREQGLEVSEADIRRGFANVSWPGRFEVLQHSPPLVIDCAHNRDSALKLRLALDDYFPSTPVLLVIGTSEDKDLQGIFAELMPRVQRVFATQSIHPRAAEPEMLVKLAHQNGRQAKVVKPVSAALEEAISHADDESMVLVTGSIFVVAEARMAYQGYHQRTA